MKKNAKLTLRKESLKVLADASRTLVKLLPLALAVGAGCNFTNQCSA